VAKTWMQRWRKVVTKKYCKHHQNLECGRKLDHNKENEQMSSYNCHKENELLHKAWANYNRENERYNEKIDLDNRVMTSDLMPSWFVTMLVTFNWFMKKDIRFRVLHNS
jgi:hypothetical protein